MILPSILPEQLFSNVSFIKSVVSGLKTFSDGLLSTGPVTLIIFLGLTIMFWISMALYQNICNRIMSLKTKVDWNKQSVAKTIKYRFEIEFARPAGNNETIIEWYFANLTFRYGHSKVYNLTKVIKWIETTPSMYIVIGVLGTFIGLVQTMSMLGPLEPSSLTKALTGLNTAFFTSIVGIFYAINTTIMLKLFNAEHVLLEQMYTLENELESESKTVQEHIRQLQTEQTQHHQYRLEQTGVESLSALNNIQVHMVTMADSMSRFDAVSDSLTKFNENFKKSTKAFDKTIERMDQISTSLVENIGTFNESFNKLFIQMELAEHSHQTIADTIERFVTEFEIVIQSADETQTKQLDAIQHHINLIHHLQGALTGWMNDVRDEMKSVANSVKTASEQFEVYETRFAEKIDKMMLVSSSLSKRLDETLKQFASIIEEQPFEIIKESVTSFGTSLVDLQKLQGEWFIHLGAFNRNLTENTEKHNAMHEAFGKLVGKMDERAGQMEQNTQIHAQMSIESNQMLADIKNAVSALEDSLKKVQQSLIMVEKFYDRHAKSNTDSLKGFISTISGTIESEFKKINDTTTILMQEKILETHSVQELSQQISQLINALNQLKAKVPVSSSTAEGGELN
jgi:hypothetical protein